MTSGAFDETAYLNANPDVRAAVDAGYVTSGFEHYITCGRQEHRNGMPPDAEAAAKAYCGVIAPEHLRVRVSGEPDLIAFVASGQVIASNILKTIPPESNLTPQSRILDFGCGCGRVISFLRRQLVAEFFGTDIDSEAIGWCKANMRPSRDFSVNGPLPPTRYSDGFFDLIYSISIFTHLPEDMQFAWLDELRRILHPGGFALLSVQGEWLFPAEKLSEMQAANFHSVGFAYIHSEITDGLPDFYRSAVHSEKYIMKHWADYFDIVRIIPRAINNHQDLVVCRAR